MSGADETRPAGVDTRFHVAPFSSSEQRKHKPRQPIPLRNWTRAQHLLYGLHISNRDVADESGVPLTTVNRILNRGGDNAFHSHVVKIRAAVERLLQESGREAAECVTLWEEYDAHLYELTDPPPEAA